jgi:hypothetical protein
MMSQSIPLNVNGRAETIKVDDPAMPLIYSPQRRSHRRAGSAVRLLHQRQIVQTAAFLSQNKKPSEAEIRKALANNLCCCGDSSTTPDQGPTWGSLSIQQGGTQRSARFGRTEQEEELQ